MLTLFNGECFLIERVDNKVGDTRMKKNGGLSSFDVIETTTSQTMSSAACIVTQGSFTTGRS